MEDQENTTEPIQSDVQNEVYAYIKSKKGLGSLNQDRITTMELLNNTPVTSQSKANLLLRNFYKDNANVNRKEAPSKAIETKPEEQTNSHGEIEAKTISKTDGYV